MTRVWPGLCSVTLRSESVDEVARLTRECGLRAIEWGGDEHVPPGDQLAARRARRASQAAGLRVVSYGSYLFATPRPTDADQYAVVDTAVAIGAPNVRVWAGFGVEPSTAEYRELVEGLGSFCARAGDRGLTVGLEYHGGTPTATPVGTVALLETVNRPELFTYWQPPYWRGPTSPESDAAEVRALAPRLSHFHVYEWAIADDRRPLAEGADRWHAVFDAARAIDSGWSGDRIALLEFVADDDPEALRRDAATLRAWLADTDS